MAKDLVGDWGSELQDGDYACAIAALGVLESRGPGLHQSALNPESIVGALRQEFVDGERTPVWRGALLPSSDDWRRTIHADAVALAAGWQMYVDPLARWRQSSIQYHERGRPRLALRPSWRSHADALDFEELIGWLQHPDVKLNALVFDDEHSIRAATAWHWPLRVGVPEGAENAGILDALRNASNAWVGELSRCFTVGRGRDHCDLLVVSSVGANRIIEQMRPRIRASMVAVLDDVPSWSGGAAERHSLIRARVRAGGAAAIPTVDGSLGSVGAWYREVIREVSHDVPVHAALTLATRFELARDPLIVGDPRAMDACRLLSIADHHDRIDAALVWESRRVPGKKSLRSEAEPTFGGPGDVQPAPPERTKAPRRRDTGKIHRLRPADDAVVPPTSKSPSRTSLGDFVRATFFTSETADGVPMLRMFSDRGQAQAEARGPRWVQASAWRKGVETPARALDPEQWNLLAVHVGPSDEPITNAPFPDERVDFSRGDVVVTVQVELAGAALSPFARTAVPPSIGAMVSLDRLVSRLERPAFEKDAPSVGLASIVIVLPAVGDSSVAIFAVYAAPGTAKVEGRISVIHRNRVLQTARASIAVATDPSAGNGMSLVTDAPIHPRDDDLEERRGYDVAIQVNDVGGKLHLAVQDNGIPKPVQLADLVAPIQAISDAIGQAAARWDYSQPLAGQPNFADALYSLAAHGSLLEQHLRKKCGNGIDEWARIQLVQETNAFFPIEYVYDGPPPNVDAAVCPNATAALDRGACSRALGPPGSPQPCPNHHDSAFLCPMHFWGFRRLIERNAVSTQATLSSQSSTPVVVTVPSKRPYGPVNGLLFAASDRAFRYVPEADRAAERAGLVEALNVFSSVSPADVPDWTKWKAAAKQKPNLLVLVPHSDQFRNAPALEIGDKKWLGQQQIDKELSGAQGEPQILLLLGCSAASVMDDFQPYPERFRDAGVSIVLAPVSPIRGADAVPIAKRLTQLLADTLTSAEPTGFGELLPRLRRELLRDGHVGVMSIVGFGDGDWLIGGA